MKYPEIQSEYDTLNAIANGASIARFGDGEFKLAMGRKCVSQEADPALQLELLHILSKETKCLVGLPNILVESPKYDFWKNYDKPDFNAFFKQDKIFHSAFITRPDSAPWIDAPEYWNKVKSLWEGRNVTLIRGGENSLMRADLVGAASVQEIITPAKNAYADINHIQAITIKTNLVILCCGAMATVLAYRLAENGTQALDLGHIGMFLRSQGSFNVKPQDLISDAYREQNQILHALPAGYGGSGHKLEPVVRKFAEENGCRSILDYGCGEGTLKKKLKENGWPFYIGEYDPAVVGKTTLPKPADMVVCTDVLEHVEPDKIDAVLQHIYSLTGKACFLNVALRLAGKHLPDGRNAHILMQSSQWWINKMTEYQWTVYAETTEGHSMKIWLKK